MTISYIAVDRGVRSDGYLVANGKVFVARSGGLASSRGEIPQGTYQLGPPLGLNRARNQHITMADGKNPSAFRKFAITGTASSREFNKKEGIWGLRDDRFPGDSRTGMMFHFDGDVVGSNGCIVYDDPQAQKALEASFSKGDTEVKVTYVKDDETARQMARELAGVDPPVSARPW